MTIDRFISILVPVYNSGYMAAEASRRIFAALEGFERKEMVFGNDGSPDASLEYLEDVSNQYTEVRVISHSNRGLGYTLNRLIHEARGDICIYLDMDLSFDVTYLPHLIQKMDDYDIAVASKYCGRAACVLPWKRRVSSRLYYTAVKLLFGVGVKDIGSGMIVFWRDRIKALALSSEGFNIHAEFFHKAHKKRYRICEEPVPYFHSQDGSFKILKHGAVAVRDLIYYALSKEANEIPHLELLDAKE